jgi:trigger factor
MFDYKKKDIGKRTLLFTVTVPQKTLDEYYAKGFDEILKDFQVEGFRKGKVPADIAKKHIKKETVYEKMMHTLFPDVYSDIVKKESLQPAVNPKLELIKAKEGEDWEFTLTVALKPEAKLGDYKKTIQEVKKNEKAEDIWVPGKDEPKKEDQEAKKIDLLNKMLDALLKTVEIEMSDLIVEEELNRRLAQLVDDVRKIGMTVENYAQSKNTTIDGLKESYKKEIADTYKLELALEEIANDAGITVEKQDLEKLFQSIQDEKARKDAEANAYFYASFLKRQKTLDYLVSL